MMQYTLKFLISKSFYIKKIFHKWCNNDCLRENEMVTWKWNVRNGKVIYGKEGFRFSFQMT